MLGSGTEKRGNPLLLLTLQAHVPKEEAALLSPCSPMWPQWDLGWWGGAGAEDWGSGVGQTESVKAREDGSA